MNSRRQVWFLTAAAAVGGGGVQHTRALLQAMSRLYGDRLVIVGRRELQTIPLPAGPASFVCVPPRSVARKIESLITLRGYDLLSPYVDKWLSANRERPAFAVLGRSWLGRFAPRLMTMGIPVVTMHENVEADYVGSTCRTPFFRSWVTRIIRSNERMALHHSAVNLTMTQEDAARLRSVYQLGDEVSLDVMGAFEPHDKPALPTLHEGVNLSPSCHIVMTGSLCDYQTVDGVAWFLTQIYPRLKERLPQVNVTIAGRSPGDRLKRLATASRVHLVADPVDMDSLVRQADVYLAVTRLGSGQKLRVGDALRCGVPVVSHEVSARGYTNLYSDLLFQTFRRPEECVAAVERVQRVLPLDLVTRKRIQSIYAERFSFSRGVARLASILGTRLGRPVATTTQAGAGPGALQRQSEVRP